MPAPPANLTSSTLPTRSSLTAIIVQQLTSIYADTLLATPQQRRHRVEPTELLRLDKQRYDTIPNTIATRAQQPRQRIGQEWPHGFATKPELQELMAWKLARGVYRPALPGLIAQNDATTVEEVTGEGFAEYAKTLGDNGSSRDAKASKPALDVLCRLRGVGPATASLLLSVAFPTHAPFFSDEIYYFFAAGQPARLEKIRYNLAEYEFIEESVRLVQRGDESAHIRADDIERTTFVIQKLHNPDVWAAAFGREAAHEGGVGAAEAIDRIVDKKEEEREDSMEKKPAPAAKKQSKKRKDVKVEETPQVAGLEEAHPPMDMDPSLTERERQRARSVKKETIEKSGGTVRHVDPELPPKKRKQELDGDDEGEGEGEGKGKRKRKGKNKEEGGLRRSGRTTKRVER